MMLRSSRVARGPSSAPRAARSTAPRAAMHSAALPSRGAAHTRSMHAAPLASAVPTAHRSVLNKTVATAPNVATASPARFYAPAVPQPPSSVVEMFAAIPTGDIARLKKALDSGADVNATSAYYQRTVLHDAVIEGNVALVELLIKRGANVNARDKFGNTPLADVSRMRNRSKAFRYVAKLLEAAGAQRELQVPTYSQEFATMLKKAIPLLAAKGGWQFGEALLPSEDGKFLQSTPTATWSSPADSATFAKLRKAAEVLSYNVEEADFPAVVVSKKTPVLLTDLSVARQNDRISEKCFQVCNSNGAKSGMAIPIYHQDQLLAVLVFLGTSPRADLDQSFIEEFTRSCTTMIDRSISNSKLTPSTTPPGGLQQQMKEVEKIIVNEGVFSENLIFQEIDQYYNRLGFRDTYFVHYPAHIIAKHVHALIAAKKVSQITGDVDNLKFDYETPDGWFFICPMTRKAAHSSELRIEDYVSRLHPPVPRDSADTPAGPRSRTFEGPVPVPYSISFFRSSGTLSTTGPHSSIHLGLYVVDRSTFREPNPAPSDTDIGRLGTETFLRERATSPQLREHYQRIVNRASATFAPVLEVLPAEDNVTPLMFAYKTTAVGSSLSSFSELFDNLNLTVERKYVDSFANGIVVHTVYVLNANQKTLGQVVEQAGLLYHVHNPALLPLLANSVERYAYAHCALNFIYYFVNQRSEEFVMLAQALKDDTVNTARLNMLQNNLRREGVTQARITECVLSYPQIVDDLYADFARVQHQPIDEPNKALLAAIKKAAQNELDEQILTAMHTFNCSILKTNFWKKDKAAISFRLKTEFLKGLYPEVPFGLFYVMGGSFRGFHMRFRDIARGGIRIVSSAGKQVYRRNLDRLFDENYSLANTQQRKNKDLPEGGSKGVVLLGTEHSDPTFSFQQYVDSILDLLLPHPEVANHYRTVYAAAKEDEILFFGPDEGTANMMDWACLHAKHRGYPFWKSFTTGKSQSLGGIPHDLYGMTTRSVHKYVTETLNKLGVREEDCTKTQMGGPDGDLGSNEILISKDKTIAVVDKSGVIYDPLGLDRTELQRLVKLRSPVQNFDPSKLSKQGFKVLQSDKDITLPDGTVIESGLSFRNEFHLTDYSTADLFVPCGGRPESINVRNVHRLFRKDGTPRFKYIIEGANLFLTQDARLQLEKAGVVLYKDASANKGGVTSSSLEVLAALALTDEEFAEHMCVRPDGSRPEFYKKYVQQVQQRIENNAYLEWACIWQEHERTGTPRCVLTDQLSLKINALTDGITAELWETSPIKRQILETAIPPVLRELVGVDKVMQRVPTNYLQAIFGAYIASHYIYHNGLQASELLFYRWMNNYLGGNAKIEV